MCTTKRDRHQAFHSNLGRLKEAFDVLDRDGDGIIAASDLELFLWEVVACKLISKEDVQRMLKLVEGDVDFDEFLGLLHFQAERDESPVNMEGNKAFKIMFEAMDRNGDGFVCADDLKSVMETLGSHLSEKDILGMLQTQGAGSSDSKVTYEQFVELMTSPTPSNGYSTLQPVRSY